MTLVKSSIAKALNYGANWRGWAGDIAPGRGRGGSLKGKKVPPKYRDTSGNTWAGRGAKPRWLVAAIKDGKKLEDFAVEKTAPGRKGRKK
jgi:DNA-binding protein H-NS